MMTWMKNELITVGIDYSMSSPSVCVHIGKHWNILNCKFYYLTTRKKHFIKTDYLIGEMHSEFKTQEERFDAISDWAISKIPKNSMVYLEDYAFGATGIVFNIGECVGLLKHKLWKNNYKFEKFAPSKIKKFATGKGNANKILMQESFDYECNVKIFSELNCPAGASPLSDIIDSYYIAKLGYYIME